MLSQQRSERPDMSLRILDEQEREAAEHPVGATIGRRSKRYIGGVHQLLAALLRRAFVGEV